MEKHEKAEVEVGVEALEEVVDFVEASTLRMDYSIEVVVEHTTGMVGLLAEDDMKGCKAK